MTMVICLLLFWIEDGRGLDLILSRLVMILGGMMIPLPLFPAWLGNICEWLPFQAVAYLLAMLGISAPKSAASLMQTPVAVAAATSLLIGFVILAQSLVFFIGGREGIGGQLAEAFLTFSHYPSTIFHGVVIRVLIFAVMPAGLISSLPSAIVDQVRPWILWVSLGVGVWQVWLGRWVFYKGLKIYSSGNRITVRA
ncbi:ABC-2 family transporter protein [Alicyclobacillus pomorum]|uniref:ABC-2 family transporter protein n=1 Tax=Alicyclobacillus pomorum TaxID=204470 RepID=UPI000A008573|nr:ABC-2 family transporter protein [Alicyclobacillus pomorum]